jgi:hypothetical protein
MKKTSRAAEVEALLREIQRYLAYVDAFRTVGSQQPSERKENGSSGDAP